MHHWIDELIANVDLPPPESWGRLPDLDAQPVVEAADDTPPRHRTRPTHRLTRLRGRLASWRVIAPHRVLVQIRIGRGGCLVKAAGCPLALHGDLAVGAPIVVTAVRLCGDRRWLMLNGRIGTSGRQLRRQGSVR